MLSRAELQDAATTTGYGLAFPVEAFASGLIEVAIAGTATIEFEASGPMTGHSHTAEQGAGWFPLPVWDVETGELVTATESPGAFRVDVTVFSHVRARITAISGTVSVWAQFTEQAMGAAFTAGAEGGSTVTEFQGRVGNQTLSDNARATLRLGRGGDQIVNLGGQYYELAMRGQLFHAQTAVTGVAPGTAIGTTAAFALANPTGSNKDLVVIVAKLGYVSGTLGAGVVDWCGHTDPAQAAITGTAITPVNGYLSGGSPQGRPFTTATVPASGKPFRVFGNLQASLASTAVAPWLIEDKVDGAIVIPPGTAVSLQATAAGGSSPVVVYSVTWAELPASS